MDDAQEGGSSRWTGVGAALLLAAFVLLFYRAFFFSCGVPVVGGGGDNLRVVYPVLDMMCREHGPAIWNPYSISGSPLYPNLQMGVRYPPAQLASLFLSTDQAFAFLYLLHGLLAASGCYLLLRALGCGRGVGLALSFLYSGCSMATIPIFLQTFAYLPFIAWSAWRIIADPPGAKAGIGFVGCVACVLLINGGSPQLFGYAMALITALLLIKCIFKPCQPIKETLRRWALLAACLLLTGAITSGSLLDNLRSGRESHRAVYANDYFNLRSGMVEQVIGEAGELCNRQAFREFFGGGDIYAAVQILMLMLMVGMLARRSAQLALFAVAGACFVYALGDMTPLAKLAGIVLPPLRYFRDPSRMLMLTPLLFLIGGGICMARLRQPAEAGDFRSAVRNIGIFAILYAIGAALSTWPDATLLPLAKKLAAAILRRDLPVQMVENFSALFGSMSDMFIHFAPYFAAGGVIALLLVKFRCPKVLCFALPVAAAIYMLAAPPVELIPREKLFPQNDLVKMLQASQEPCRTVNMALSRSRFIDMAPAMLHKIEMADGADPVIPADYYEYWFKAFEKPKIVYPSTSLQALAHTPDEILDMDVLCKWNVRYLLSGKPATRADLRQVAVFENLPSYVFPRTSGSYAKVYVYEVAGWRQRCWIADADKDKGVVSKITRNNLRVECTVEATEPLLLVNASAVPQDWKATIDGADAPVVISEGCMPAVNVPPGMHKVEFMVAPRNHGWLGLARWGVYFPCLYLLLVLGLDRKKKAALPGQ